MGEIIPIDETVTEIIKKLSFKEKTWNFLKRLGVVLAIFMMLFKGLKWWANHVRRVFKMSVTDEYDEKGVWETLVWVKFWRLVYGFAFGLIAAYLWNLDISIWEWLQETWKLILDVLG